MEGQAVGRGQFLMKTDTGMEGRGAGSGEHAPQLFRLRSLGQSPQDY